MKNALSEGLGINYNRMNGELGVGEGWGEGAEKMFSCRYMLGPPWL